MLKLSQRTFYVRDALLYQYFSTLEGGGGMLKPLFKENCGIRKNCPRIGQNFLQNGGGGKRQFNTVKKLQSCYSNDPSHMIVRQLDMDLYVS